MPKKKHYDVDQKLSDIIHDLFQGDPKNLDKKRLIKIYNDKKINVNFQRIDESNLKDLSKNSVLNSMLNQNVHIHAYIVDHNNNLVRGHNS